MSSMFCKKIYQCRNADWCARDFNPKSDCPECFEQITNYDLLISKTPEQLADWLADILNHCENKKPEELCRMSCPLYKCCNNQPSDNIEDWLKSPVEVET